MGQKMTHKPDNWVVIKFEGKTPHYKILGGWSGGYLDGDSWRMNSGIVRVEEDEEDKNRLNFYGASGSCYSCHKESYTLRMNNAFVWAKLNEQHGDKVTLMDEDTDWSKMDWLIS